MTQIHKISSEPAQDDRLIELFPLSFPEELHASQAGRYHVDSGNATTRESFRQLYGAPPFRTTHWIPAHLESFARKLPGSITGNIEALLRNNTLFPLFETFGNAMLSLSDDAIPIAQQIRHMPKRIVGESGEIQLCAVCLREDWSKLGRPYIHCAHQIPGVDICWRHGCRLLTRCPSCRSPFEMTNHPNLILAPWERCACGHYLPEVSHFQADYDIADQELRYTQFARAMLDSKSQHLSAEVLASLYKRRLGELGFSRKSQIDRRAVIAALEEHFGINLLAKIDVAYRTGKTQEWMRLANKGSVFEVPLGRHLLLAYFLFREAPLFWNAVAATRSEIETQAPRPSLPATTGLPPNIPYHEPIVTQVPPPPVQDLPSRTQQKILQTLQQHPDWTLDDLWREYPGTLKKLLRTHRDGLEWLKRQMNPVECPDERLQANSHHSANNQDSAWAKKFKDVALSHYASTEKPVKMTCNRIMQHAGWPKPDRPSELSHPSAREALESVAETRWHFYARRILWSILTVGPARTADWSIIEAANVEYHRGRDLLAFFSTVPSTLPLVPGTIMEILDRHGIKTAWEGLQPKPKYVVTGRKYAPRHRKSLEAS